MKRLINQGQAIRSTLAFLRVTHFIWLFSFTSCRRNVVNLESPPSGDRARGHAPGDRGGLRAPLGRHACRLARASGAPAGPSRPPLLVSPLACFFFPPPCSTSLR